jgi:hypothetical protein
VACFLFAIVSAPSREAGVASIAKGDSCGLGSTSGAGGGWYFVDLREPSSANKAIFMLLGDFFEVWLFEYPLETWL